MSQDRPPIQLPLFDHATKKVNIVAKLLGICEQSVYRLIKRGVLRGYRHGRRGWWYIYTKSLIEYEQKLRREYPPDPPSE